MPLSHIIWCTLSEMSILKNLEVLCGFICNLMLQEVQVLWNKNGYLTWWQLWAPGLPEAQKSRVRLPALSSRRSQSFQTKIPGVLVIRCLQRSVVEQWNWAIRLAVIVWVWVQLLRLWLDRDLAWPLLREPQSFQLWDLCIHEFLWLDLYLLRIK